jgi:hypothetical protein
MSQKIRIALGFQRYTDQEIVTLAGAVIQGMTGNAAFPNPPVELAAAQTALDEYSAALAANLHGGATATATKNNKRDALTGILEKLGHYVQTHSNNDREVLLSSGFQPIAPRAGSSVPAKPVVLAVKNGSTTQLLLRAKAVARARCYEVRAAAVISGGEPGPWQTIGLSTTPRSIPINGLIPGTHYAVQIRAVGAAGTSDWSDSVVHVCW